MRLLLAILCVTLAGCGNGLSSVTGNVTLDGKPLAKNDHLSITVQFAPEGGHGVLATADLDENGHYSLSSGSRRGVLPGKYLVSISGIEIIPPKIAGGAPGGRLATPAKYTTSKTSGFMADVAPGRNNFDFALSSHP
jgi:hypothetical protein